MTIAEVKQAALADDVPGFVDALVELAHEDVYWGLQLDALRKAVELGELPWRVPAAVAISQRLSSVTGEDARTLLDYVIDYLLIDQSRAASVPDALAILGIAARYWEFLGYVEMERLGATVLKSGGRLGPEVVAVMRRTAAIPGNRPLKAFVAGLKEPLLNLGEPWADRALADLSMLDDNWRELVAHAAKATGDTPTPEWEAEGGRLLAQVGPDTAREVILGWLTLIGLPRTLGLRNRAGGSLEYRADAYNSMVLRGLVWLLGLLPPGAQLTRCLADLAETSLRKVPAIGPRNRLVAEGAIHALSRLDSMDAVAELVRLVTRVTHRTAAQRIQTALQRQLTARQPWRYGTWRALVLDHVVVGALARRLLWRVDDHLCGYADGALRFLDGTPAPGDSGLVRLWDPATSSAGEVLAVREWLARHGITQPFPQAADG